MRGQITQAPGTGLHALGDSLGGGCGRRARLRRGRGDRHSTARARELRASLRGISEREVDRPREARGGHAHGCSQSVRPHQSLRQALPRRLLAITNKLAL